MAGRLYDVTLRLRIEPGPSFEDKKITVRAYDANDAMLQATIEASLPVEAIVKVEPASVDWQRQLADLERMLRSSAEPPDPEAKG